MTWALLSSALYKKDESWNHDSSHRLDSAQWKRDTALPYTCANCSHDFAKVWTLAALMFTTEGGQRGKKPPSTLNVWMKWKICAWRFDFKESYFNISKTYFSFCRQRFTPRWFGNTSGPISRSGSPLSRSLGNGSNDDRMNHWLQKWSVISNRLITDDPQNH